MEWPQAHAALMGENVENDDTEVAHARADRELVETFRETVLLGRALSEYEAKLLLQIIDDYENVGKWYA